MSKTYISRTHMLCKNKECCHQQYWKAVRYRYSWVTTIPVKNHCSNLTGFVLVQCDCLLQKPDLVMFERVSWLHCCGLVKTWFGSGWLIEADWPCGWVMWHYLWLESGGCGSHQNDGWPWIWTNASWTLAFGQILSTSFLLYIYVVYIMLLLHLIYVIILLISLKLHNRSPSLQLS